MVQWTQKEASLLQDLKGQEQLCVDKYNEYAQRAHDPELKNLFTSIGETEVGHLKTLTDMLNGQMPQQQGQQSQQAQGQQSQQCQCSQSAQGQQSQGQSQQGSQGQQNAQGQQSQGQSQQRVPDPGQCRQALTPEMQQDAYLCKDLLADEKYVSSSYNTSIFEFSSPQARQILNGIQSAEQQHGEQLYAYMARHGMYQM